jgi:MoaA/NifB/PqqE/SkfB family radical SAM enzyme
MTVQDSNCEDLVPLYELSDKMGMEFATATLHNSFYFHKDDNKVNDKYKVAQNFEKLINELLKSKSPKKWFRAYFNHGLINYIYGNKRLLPCDMSNNAFFIDPFCDVVPCNGMKEKAVMGNLREQDWNTLWNSDQAQKVRECTKHCDRNCWMIGSVSPAMHKYIWVPAWWVIKHKIFGGGKYSLAENSFIKRDE